MSPEEPLHGVGGAYSCSADVAAYALGALGDTEARSFQRHLESCAICPVELTAFQQVVDHIAVSTPPFPAPLAVKRRVMSVVDGEPHPTTVERRAPRTTPRVRWRPNLPVIGLVSGGAFAVAAVIVGIVALPGREASRTIAAQVTGSGRAALTISGGHAELALSHFAPPPRGKVYEVWLKHGSATPSPTSELFSVPHDGNTSVDVPGSLHGVTKVLVTPEPFKGSRVPTHKPVISATL